MTRRVPRRCMCIMNRRRNLSLPATLPDRGFAVIPRQLMINLFRGKAFRLLTEILLHEAMHLFDPHDISFKVLHDSNVKNILKDDAWATSAETVLAEFIGQKDRMEQFLHVALQTIPAHIYMGSAVKMLHRPPEDHYAAVKKLYRHFSGPRASPDF